MWSWWLWLLIARHYLKVLRGKRTVYVSHIIEIVLN